MGTGLHARDNVDWLIALLLLLAVAALSALVARVYRRVGPDRALVIDRGEHTEVVFGGALVWPLLQRVEAMELSLHTIEVSRRGEAGLMSADGLRLDVRASFAVRVERTPEAVLQVARTVGCAGASDPRVLAARLGARLSEALEVAASELSAETILRRRGEFRARTLALLGDVPGGFTVEDVALDRLERSGGQVWEDASRLGVPEARGS